MSLPGKKRENLILNMRLLLLFYYYLFEFAFIAKIINKYEQNK